MRGVCDLEVDCAWDKLGLLVRMWMWSGAGDGEIWMVNSDEMSKR